MAANPLHGNSIYVLQKLTLINNLNHMNNHNQNEKIQCNIMVLLYMEITRKNKVVSTVFFTVFFLIAAHAPIRAHSSYFEVIVFIQYKLKISKRKPLVARVIRG